MTEMKRLFFLLIILLLGGVSGCSYTSMNATTLMENALNATDDFTPYELVMETDFLTEHYSVADRETQRIDQSDKDGLFFSQLYKNGALYEIDHHLLEIIKHEEDGQLRMPTARELFLDEVEFLSVHYDIELLGEDTFLKRDVYKLRFVEMETKKRYAELWVDKESFVLLKMIYLTEDNKELVTEATYFKLNPQFDENWFELEDHLFTHINNNDIFDSISYDEIETQFAGPLYLPTFQNEEWAFKEAKVAYENELAYVVATFISNSGKEVQLFIQDEEAFHLPLLENEELIEVRGNDVSFVWEPSHHTAYWQEEGLRYSLFTKRDWLKEEAIRFIEEMSFVKL